MNKQKLERWAYNADELAEILGISRSSAYALIKGGTIPSVRLGRLVRVPADSLQVWMKENETVAGAR
jgi:excisionase family DNA binding protein